MIPFGLNYSKENKAYGVYSKIREHMGEPGGVYVLAFFVENIEYHSAHVKSCKREKHYSDAEPADHHSRVVERECKRAEAMREFARSVALECEKGKAAEEEFFKQGIDERDVE